MTIRPVGHAGDRAVGERYGLDMPAHAAAFALDPVPFLNRAFRAYGSLPPDNQLVAVDRIEPFTVGSSGQKLLLSVSYARPDPRLPQELFVKFSRHFGDAFFDRRRFELDSEVRFYELSRTCRLPIAIPRPMFGDFEPTTGTGLLVIEQIPFGIGDVEPHHPKCMDHLLPRPLDYYRAVVTTLARLAGFQHRGGLDPQLDRLLPFDAQAAVDEDAIERDEDELRAQVADLALFIRQCPRLFPAALREADVIARLEPGVLWIAREQRAIRRYLHADPDYVALTHFNPNLDNGWFWREPDGTLGCGLLDWQRGRRMNVAYALWGGLCAADPDIWAHELDGLLALFAREYRAAGGPALDPAVIRLHMHLYSATMGVAGMLGAPALIRGRQPAYASALGPSDPLIRSVEGVRCFLHILTAFLTFWEMDGFSRNLPGLLAGPLAGHRDE